MENGQNLNAIGTQHSFIMNLHDKKDSSKGRSDILTRRLKNRERQRRYRARKRLEADMKKDSVTIQLTTPQVELEPSGRHNNYIARVHCKRNWKKDARAHAHKNLKETLGGDVFSPTAMYVENPTSCLALGIMGEPPTQRQMHTKNSLSLPSGTTCQSKGRRDWKAEARNKKN